MGANLGQLFYKDIYHITSSGIKSNQQQIKVLLERKIDEDEDEWIETGIEEHSITLITSYPGLITGIGLAHGVSGDDDDFKFGFSFDHTLGLPVIYGSSVKGLLRSVFPKFEKNTEIKNVRYKWIQSLLDNLDDKNFDSKEIQPKESITKEEQLKINEIESEIFDGIKNDNYLSIYERDIFYDALLFYVKDKNIFLGIDYITPHPNPIKNPKPIKFLKVLPDVEFKFQFNLKDGKYLTAIQKRALFDKILFTLGIGAKTNVGYGQFQ